MQDCGADKRTFERKDVQVLVHFNFHGHEKVFESTTRNISLAGLFIEADDDIISLMNVGGSIMVMIECKKNFFVKINGYIVRLHAEERKGGFAVKFLELEEIQKETLLSIINS